MGYVAVSGGEQAIASSLELLECERVAGGRALDPALIIESMPRAVEQVQSEGSVWAPEVAAIALKQHRAAQRVHRVADHTEKPLVVRPTLLR